MSDTTFIDYQTVVPASWLNDVNSITYNSTDPTKGDALVAVKSTKTGGVATTQHQVNEERTSVFQFMNAAQIASVIAGDLVQDVTSPLQAAATALPTVTFPVGIYKISAPITLRTDSKFFGTNSARTRIHGTHAGVMCNIPVDNVMTQFDNIYFTGFGCTALYVNPASVGSLTGYLNMTRVTNCEFGYDLGIGISASYLLCKFTGNGFGRIGVGVPATSGFVAVRGVAVGPQANNQNLFDSCSFQNAGGTIASPSPPIYFNGGTELEFHSCDFEGNSTIAYFVNMGNVRFTGNTHIERCGANAPAYQTPYNSGVANGIAVPWCILCEDLTTPLIIEGGIVSACTTTTAPNSFIQWNNNAGIPAIPGGVTLRNIIWGLSTNQRPVYTGIINSYKLHPKGTITWTQNYVTGGHAANTMITGTQFQGPDQVRASGVISGAGTIIKARGDTGLVSVRNSAGDYTLTFSNPVAETVAAAAIFIEPQNASIAIERALNVTDLFTVNVMLFSAAGAATDATFSYLVI